MEKTISMKYPLDESYEFNWFDGQYHNITPDFLGRIGDSDYYLMDYFDEKKEGYATTILTIIDGKFVKVPFNNYDLAFEFIRGIEIKREDLSILPSTIECTEIKDPKDFFSNFKYAQSSPPNSPPPTNENNVENPPLSPNIFEDIIDSDNVESKFLNQIKEPPKNDNDDKIDNCIHLYIPYDSDNFGSTFIGSQAVVDESRAATLLFNEFDMTKEPKLINKIADSRYNVTIDNKKSLDFENENGQKYVIHFINVLDDDIVEISKQANLIAIDQTSPINVNPSLTPYKYSITNTDYSSTFALGFFDALPVTFYGKGEDVLNIIYQGDCSLNLLNKRK